MLAAHALGASIVEALVTGLGVAYLQRRHPEYLTSLRRVFAPDADAEGTVAQRPLWQLVACAAAGCVVLLAIVGLVEGGGSPARMFGLDWSQVDWPSVATMLLVTAIVGIVIVPAAYLLLPRAIKRVGTAFVAIAVLAPIGLIAPGFAYGEGSSGDVNAAFGYVPSGLQSLSGIFSAPLAGYDIPLPFFSEANAPLWHAAIGYEIAGIIGVLVVGGVVYGIARLLRGGAAPEPAEPAGPTAERATL
jgi:cobalt/nickel transport system permease protein/cobalt/nickel transport protein